MEEKEDKKRRFWKHILCTKGGGEGEEEDIHAA